MIETGEGMTQLGTRLKPHCRFPQAKPQGLCHGASLLLTKYTGWMPETLPLLTPKPSLSPTTLTKNGFCKEAWLLGPKGRPERS